MPVAVGSLYRVRLLAFNHCNSEHNFVYIIRQSRTGRYCNQSPFKYFKPNILPSDIQREAAIVTCVSFSEETDPKKVFDDEGVFLLGL